MDQKSILFIYQNYSSFVKADFEILQSEYIVTHCQFKPVKGILNLLFEWIRQFYFLLLHFRKFDAVYIWFADYHSFLPILFAKMMGRKSFLVIGGYDVCRMKKYNYGVFSTWWRGFCALYSMNNCTLNLTVSTYVDRKLKYIAPSASRQLIYNCVFLENTEETIPKTNSILTIAILNNERTFYMKGIDLFIALAGIIKDYEFIIVGIDQEKLAPLLTNLPANVKLHGKVPHQDLVSYYKEAKFYCQFSIFESFGVSIAEGISYGCIPLVTNGGAMPEIVGDARYIVNRNAYEMKLKIQELEDYNLTFELSQLKSRFDKMFSFKVRKEKLLNLLNRLTT